MTKKEIFSVVVVVWLIASTGYVIYDQWTNYQINGIQKTYSEVISQVVSEAENADCQPFSVYSGEKKVELISISCLQQPASQEKQSENSAE